MYVRVGITQNRPTGNSWKVVNSPGFKHVSAGDSAIWGIDEADNINYFTGNVLFARVKVNNGEYKILQLYSLQLSFFNRTIVIKNYIKMYV